MRLWIALFVIGGFVGCKSSSNAGAENFGELESTTSTPGQISCWNIYAKAGSKPKMVLTATSDTQIHEITFVPDEDRDETKWLKTSYPGPFQGTVITSNHSPYKDNNEFFLNKDGMRLILPARLDKNSIRTTIIHGDRETAVLQVSPSVYNFDHSISAGGDIFIRMNCKGGR